MGFPSVIRFGDFEFDPGAFKLRRDGRALPVEPKALDVLQLLIARAPQVVDKAEIFSIVWKDVAVTDNALTRVVAQLRRTLDDDPKAPRYIETVATRGYRFVAPIASDVPPPAPPDNLGRPAPRRVTYVAALVVAAIAAMGTWAGLRLPGSASGAAASTHGDLPDVARLAALHPEQLTAGKGYDGFLAFAPDGKSMAFSSDRSGALEIYVQGIAPGSTVTALTSNGRQNVQPAWSPDGDFIAYHEMAGNGIWVVPSRGGVARKISDYGSRPRWSPDGRLIAFQEIPANQVSAQGVPGALGAIGIVEASGHAAPANVTKPGTPGGPHLGPAWFDNSHVWFAAGSSSGDHLALWSVNVNAGELRQVVDDKYIGPDFVIAPDRRSVYFTSIRTEGIWRVALPADDEAPPVPQATGLQTAGATTAQLTMSSDGRRIGWTTTDTSNHVWARASASRPGPQDAVALTHGFGMWHSLPAPASDGRVLLAGARPGSFVSLFLLDRSAMLRQLTTHPPAHGGGQWMPGEREIAFITDHGEGAAYWALDPETGRERLLFMLSELPIPIGESQYSSASRSVNIAFSRDFKRLAMGFVKDGRQNIWVAGLKNLRPDGSLIQKTFERDGGSYPTWSPDGKWIAYECADGTDTHVCVVNADNGERAQITHEPGQSWVGAWGPDNDTILFAARRDAVWNIAAVLRTTGALRTLTRFTGAESYVRYPRWDGANDRVVFERSETTARIWSVELPH